MEKILCVWKPIGITPLDAINILKKKNSKYKHETISYAGRLDPMAEGIIVLLVGDENKNRDKYLGLDKTYETEIVYGISTDTFDALGLITNINIKNLTENEIKIIMNKFIGKKKQLYPPYSSKTVNGKPLYWWARNNKLSEINIPNHNIEIYSINLLSLKKIVIKNLTKYLIAKVEKTDGDFRQKEIIKKWNNLYQEYGDRELIKTKLLINCSSGTYIRRIADDLGKELKTNAFASSIKRIRVGKFTRDDCLKVS